jgi:hypothetical protein
MNPTTNCEKTGRCRFEDSFSLPENQRICPDDAYVFEHEKESLIKWHKKSDSEMLEEIMELERQKALMSGGP